MSARKRKVIWLYSVAVIRLLATRSIPILVILSYVNVCFYVFFVMWHLSGLAKI